MPTVEFEGKTNIFPDDFTEQDIAKALKSQTPSTWGEALDVRQVPRAMKSGVENVKTLMLKEGIEQRPEEGTVASGINTTPGGAATANVPASAVIRQERLRSQEEAQVPAQEKAAATATARLKEVTPQNPTTGQEIASSVMQSAGPLAAGLAVGLVNPAAGAAIAVGGGTVLQGGSTYGEAREKGATSHQAARAAGIDSILEAAGESLGLGVAFKQAFKFGSPLLRKMLVSTAAEGGQELVTQVMQDAHAKMTYNPELTFDEAVHNAIVATGAGATMGGGVAAGGHGLSKIGVQPGDIPIQGPSGEIQGIIPKDVFEAELKGQNSPGKPPIKTQPVNNQLDSVITEMKAQVNPEDLTDEHATQAKAKIAAFTEAQNATPPNPATVARLAGLDTIDSGFDASELGDSSKVAANARNYLNENDSTARSKRVVFAGPESAVGKTLEQTDMAPATYVIGSPTEDRPGHYLQAVHDTIETWRQQFLPDSPLIISNESLKSRSATGWHSMTETGLHLIVPAVLRQMKDSAAFNTNAQIKPFYNLAHEFGHALVEDKFFDRVPASTAAAIEMQSNKGLVDEQLIAQLPPETAAVVQEFNAIKSQVLSGAMTAREFVDAWMGPAKVHRKAMVTEHGVADNAPATQLVDAILRRAARNRGLLNNAQIANMRSEYLGLHEYLAEQMARHAYAQKWDTASAMNTDGLFARAFASARASIADFFKLLKREGDLAPGTKFAEWLDGLATPKVTTPTPGATIRKAKPRLKSKPATAEPVPVERLDHNVETESISLKEARVIVTGLIDLDVVKRGSPFHKELVALVKSGDMSTFMSKVQPLLEKHVKFELDTTAPDEWLDDYFGGYIDDEAIGVAAAPLQGPKLSQQAAVATPSNAIPENVARNPAILLDAAKEWRLFGFASKYFKAWFGDWELGQPGEHSQVVTGMSKKPLVVYHATKTANGELFDTFDRGDIGFHFGTLRAAMNRAYAGGQEGSPPTLAEAWDTMEQTEQRKIKKGFEGNQPKPIAFLPIVLNIRNPLVIAEEYPEMWNSPHTMLAILQNLGIVTYEERVEVHQQIADVSLDYHENRALQYQSFEGVRKLLESKGYDGISYENTIEGDRSFVAFHPEQVKSVLGTKTFSRSPKIHLELEYDASDPSGEGAGVFRDKFKRFFPDFGPMSRALHWITNLRYRALDLQYESLQLQQLAHINPDVDPLQFMNEKNTQYELFKSTLLQNPDKVIHQWGSVNFGKEHFVHIGQFLQAEDAGQELWVDLTKAANGTWSYAPNEVFYKKLKEFKIDPESEAGQTIGKLVLDVKNSLLDQVNHLEDTLLYLYGRRYGASPEILAASVNLVRKQIHDIRKKPFFPQGRFGNLMLIIQKERPEGGFNTVHREAFESRQDWEAAWEKAYARKRPDEKVIKKELTDTEYVLMAIPEDFLDLAVTELDLTGDQRENLQNLLYPVRKEKGLTPYDQSRLGIKGASSDAMRSFANFTWHNANTIAKLRYRAEFNHALIAMGSQLRAAEVGGAKPSQVHRLTKIKRYMEKTRDYVMSPPNEAHMVRSFVALSYLALNVKTALLNATSLMTTWSDITSQFGQVEGNKIFGKALYNAAASITWTDPFGKANIVKGLDPKLQEWLNRATNEGVLSQSYAYHLAEAASQNNLYRLPSQRIAGRAIQRGVDKAMWMFRMTELGTRRVSFLANIEAERLRPTEAMTDPYTAAVMRTAQTQNDYSHGNRVPFMRGSKGKLGWVPPVATIFMSFSQWMAFHALGGYELGKYRQAKEHGNKFTFGYTMKLAIILLVLAGYEGLPLAENLLDILDVMWKKIARKPMRQEIREFVQAVGGDPVLWAHGLGHSVAGFDISRSVGLGRLVPGTDTLAKATKDSSIDSDVGTMAFNLVGPAGQMLHWMLSTALDKKPAAEHAKSFPGAIGNMVTALDWSQHGVRDPYGGMLIRDLDTGQLRDPNGKEIIGKALGFNPTSVSNEREIRFKQYDALIYWQSRRGRVFDDYWRAYLNNDREAIADVRKAIDEFNSEVPEGAGRGLKITPKELAASRQKRIANKRLSEQGKAPQRRYNELYRGIRESFDETE